MINVIMRDELGVETLLDLNEQIIDQENGYWIKIAAWRVEASNLFRMVSVTA